ncbi:nitric-oxide reductase large subunit [Mesoterricola silvestris]|uniref:Nitric-oxide reductase large subunit n=1 Tax=Mesoterricola silvestris TaxID=2927979 RepID=A0AA48KBY4_9BACT|nr:nitric-oxide reductase large subunit [Mesoterricola silvestris]BDU74797.1 nitric-oxide reductase large subunit [Mesoterricola silvestris]
MKQRWLILLLVLIASFGVLGIGGRQIALNAPPIPASVVGPDGRELVGAGQILDGQKSYLGHGGQHIGSIWGHGAYLAPDWTAKALHRWAELTLAQAKASGLSDAEARARTQAAFQSNSFQDGTLTLDAPRAAAYAATREELARTVFGGDRDAAIPARWIPSMEEGERVADFFLWTAWTAAARRPGEDVSYTQNWPQESLVGNQITPISHLWSILSIVLLILGVGLMVWFQASQKEEAFPAPQPMTPEPATPSQRWSAIYFAVAMALFMVQILMGVFTAHYAVESNSLYGIDLSRILPYAATRTWHLQLAVFWIATCWLATGLYLGPKLAGREPKGQYLGVAGLLVALVVVVVGALTGSQQAILGRLSGSFMLGHQGYEYVELGRLWQILLTVGMVGWLVLVVRAIRPALAAEKGSLGLLKLFLLAAVAIPLFYSAGFMYNRETHLALAEYWRWWVVHLWVEGFFEVFATVAIALLSTRLGLLREKTALRSVNLSMILFLGSGIIGTFHHLYFSGSPAFISALGSMFSALEIVPLTIVGFELAQSLRAGRALGSGYEWPFKFFAAVCFWNLIGAGVFGMLINPPSILYYGQGLNTTPIHSHAALFGVYGFLAIALMLFALRGMTPDRAWDGKLLKTGFWGLNLGLVLMLVLSLIPSGLNQIVQSLQHGTWFARSAAVVQSPFMRTLTWMRFPGDVLFGVGALAVTAFTIKAVIAAWKWRKA